MVSESQKCILLCAICHREIHYPDAYRDKIENLKTISEYSLLTRPEPYSQKCKYCGKSMAKTGKRVYCSETCRKQAKIQEFKKYPSILEVEEKYKELLS